jgi:hypothetical protein
LHYKSGALNLMDYLRNISELKSIYFFTNAHSTPFYSHLHKNIKMEFLTSDAFDKFSQKGGLHDFE